MGVLSRKVKSRGRAATLLRGVLYQWWQKNITTPAAPVESPNSKTASPLLERCAQFRLELTVGTITNLRFLSVLTKDPSPLTLSIPEAAGIVPATEVAE